MTRSSPFSNGICNNVCEFCIHVCNIILLQDWVWIECRFSSILDSVTEDWTKNPLTIYQIYLTLPEEKQICSRWLWTFLGQNREKLLLLPVLNWALIMSNSPLAIKFSKASASYVLECICKREGVNPFRHTTILQTILNIFCQKIENLYNWMNNLCWKVENILAKGEMARFEQFLLLSLCFQKAFCCRGVRKRLYEGKG